MSSTPVANRIATQLPAAPDLANAMFLVEKLPATLPDGSTFRGLVYSINNLDQVMGITGFNYASQLTIPVVWSSSGLHVASITDHFRPGANSAGMLNNFSQIALNKYGATPQGAVFSFTEAGGVALDRSLPGVVLYGINDLGWLLGIEPELAQYSPYDESYYGRHFVRTGSGDINFALPPGTDSGAFFYGVNLFGEVAGSSQAASNNGSRGLFGGTDGRTHWLATYGSYEEAYALNNAQQIVGTTSAPDPQYYEVGLPAFWENRAAGITALPTIRRPDGYEYAWANKINRWGHIVGKTRAGGALWVNNQPVNFAGRLLNPDNLTIGNLKDINDRGVMLGDQVGAEYQSGAVSFRLRPLWPQLAVDANRDGQIKFGIAGTIGVADVSDATSAGKPYRFWVNNDDDTTNGSPEWSDLDPEFYPPRRPDSADRVIHSARDCEDLTRIWLSLDGLADKIKNAGDDLYVGLKWKNTGGTSPSIRLFRSADTGGGLGHIKDASVAGLQTNKLDARRFDFCIVHTDYANLVLDPIDSNPAIDQVAAGPNTQAADFVFPKSVFADLSGSQPVANLLFEGVREGKGELTFVIVRKKSDGTWEKILDGNSIWLQLDDIRRMYLRVHSTPVDDGFPFPWAQTSPPAEPYVEHSNTTGKPITIPDAKLGFDLGDTGQDGGNYGFVPDADEQAKCVVFVHGIDMTVDAQRGYSQSFFKRLWWEGYRGRFVAFRWNTPLSGLAENFLPFAGEPNVSIFNSGEYRSWKAGTGLNKFLSAQRDPNSPLFIKPNTVVGLVAHSLGNACAGEALRQGAIVDSYVAMEAAISLSCYYPDSEDLADQPPAVARLLDAEAQHQTPKLAHEGGYQGYLHGHPGINLPHKVSYNNQDDFWLVAGTLSVGTEVNWIKNEASYKPDDRYGLGQYKYDTLFFVGLVPYFERGSSFGRLVNDPHESMSFVSRPRSRAFGAGVPPGNGFGSVNLNFSYGFGPARYDHSGQFQRNIQLMYGNQDGVQWAQPLYRRLILDLGVN